MQTCPKCQNEMDEGSITSMMRDTYIRADLEWNRKVGDKKVFGFFGENTEDIYEFGKIIGLKCQNCNYLELKVVDINTK